MLRNTFELFYCHYFHFLQNFKTTVIYLKLSDYWSRISTRTVGNIVSLLLATDEIATVVTEFVVLAVCISGWWKNLHWLLLTISLHWRRREQFDTWSQLARLRQLKHPWFSLTALNGHLGFIAMNFKHWSVQWVGSLASAVSGLPLWEGHWLAGWRDPHLKQMCSNLQPEQGFPAWKVHQVPLGNCGWKRFGGFSQSALEEWDLLQEVNIVWNQSSQWIWSHRNRFGSDWLKNLNRSSSRRQSPPLAQMSRNVSQHFINWGAFWGKRPV